MKRLNESALRNMIRKLRQTGVVREPKMTRGRRCARVEVGDLVMSRMFARGYRQDGVTVVGTDPQGPGVRVAFNPLRARATYVVESVQEGTTAGSGQLVRARRLARDGRYDSRGEVIVFRQVELNAPRSATAVLVVGRLKPETERLLA